MSLTGWLAAFAFTQVVEMPIYMTALRRRPLPERAWLAFAASAITHPVVYFVFTWLMPVPEWPYWLRVALAESFAVGVEALFLRRVGLRDALLWSVGANAASASLGTLCRVLWGFP